MNDANRPLDQFRPEDLEHSIDELVSEMGREGGEYELRAEPTKTPWYSRIWEALFSKKRED